MKYFKFTLHVSRFTFPISLLLLLFALTAAAPARPHTPIKISAALWQTFQRQGEANYWVAFADRADLSGAQSLSSKQDKSRFVYDRLREQALRTQSTARALLQQEGVTFFQHYLLDAMEVRSDLQVARKLAALPEVERLSELLPIRANLPTPSVQLPASNSQLPTSDLPSLISHLLISNLLISELQLPTSNFQPPTPQPPNHPTTQLAVEWGVSRVRAPQVWSKFNVRGEGVVVGSADTGVNWDHPALKPHYRGWNGSAAEHTYNWHDAIHDSVGNPCGNNSIAPCDDYGHGTHVTGTMVGDDGAGNQIGVAPGAKWIGCRNMNKGDGTIARYTECFEFMLAPYPPEGSPMSNGRPDLGADIINNSWSCPVSEGCDQTHLNDLRVEVQRMEAGGILVVAAAGNEGATGCSTVAEPIAIYAETFSVGAVNSADVIADFSSRGPVTIDGSNRRKPNVSAPGVNVRSSFPGGVYGTSSGTSMATPHTSGVAALLWSAVPRLNGNIAETKAVLQNSADARTTSQGCGGDSSSTVPNNVYGFGIVNAYAAIQFALTFNKTIFMPWLVVP